MSILNRVFAVLLLAALIQGCSRPGSSSVVIEEDKFYYSFVAEDGKLVGLQVTDNTGAQATEVESGVYQFAEGYVPQAPIVFRSQNATTAGTTFQDLDNDGQRTGADLDYNVGFEIAYLGSFDNNSERQLFANPLTALIPASGIPSAGIAGLPQQVFEIAISQGVAGAATTPITLSEGNEVPANEIISRSVVLITAVQEGIVKLEGGDADAVEAALQFIVTLNESDLDSGLVDTTVFSAAVQPAIEVNVSQENTAVTVQISESLGTSLAATDSADLTFMEALVLLIQDNVEADSTVESIQQTITAESLEVKDNNIELSVKLEEEIAASGGLATFLASLRIVPIPIGDNGQSLVDAQVTGFSLEHMAATETVKISATNAFFDQSELTFFFEDDLYGVKVDNDHAILMALNANETNLLGAAFNGTNPARLLALCWRDTMSEQTDGAVCGEDNTNLEFYALATEQELCGIEFAAIFDEILLASVNQLNSVEISCSE